MFSFTCIFLYFLFILSVWNRYEYELPIEIFITDFLAEVDIHLTFSTIDMIQNGTMIESCEDFMFIKKGTNESIPYWVESGCGLNKTHVWIRLFDPPFGSNNISMLFNDPKFDLGADRNRKHFDGDFVFPGISDRIGGMFRRLLERYRCPTGSVRYSDFESDVMNRFIRIDNVDYTVDKNLGGVYGHRHESVPSNIEMDEGHRIRWKDDENNYYVSTASLNDHVHDLPDKIETNTVSHDPPFYNFLLCVRGKHELGTMLTKGLVFLHTDNDLVERNIRRMDEMDGLFVKISENVRGIERGMGYDNHTHSTADDDKTSTGEVSAGGSTSFSYYQANEMKAPIAKHQHKIIGKFEASSHIPLFRTAIFYEVEEDSPDGLLPNTLVWTDSKAIPMGWEDWSEEYHGRFIRGSSTDSDTIGGLPSHTHPVDVATVQADMMDGEIQDFWELTLGDEGEEYSNQEHSHKLFLSDTSPAENLPRFLNFALMKRKNGKTYATNFKYDEIIRVNWECFETDHKSSKVCRGSGFCYDVDKCDCDSEYYGITCEERIAAEGTYNSRDQIYVPWEVDVEDIQNLDPLMEKKFDCGIVLASPIHREVKFCTWKNVKLTRTSYLVVMLNNEGDIISSIDVKSITALDQRVIRVRITPLKIDEESENYVWVIALVVPSTICFFCAQLFCLLFGGLFIFAVVLLLCASFCPCFFRVYVRQRKGLAKLARIDGIDILLVEQESRKDHSIAKLKINRSLFEVKYEEIHILERLNTPSNSASIYRVMWEEGKTEACFKMFNTNLICGNQNKFEEFEREVGIMSSVKHPSLIKFYGALLHEPRVGILMEFCHNGNIKSFMETFPQKFRGAQLENNERIRILGEIASGMAYIHDRSIIHRDLKCENVLLTNLTEVRIMDFGLSKVVQTMNEAKTRKIGTSWYMAPEVVRGFDYDNKCDVFSFGVMMFEIICNNFEPFGSMSSLDCAIEFRIANDPSFRPVTNRSVTLNTEVNWLIPIWKLCWNHESAKRPSFEEVRESLISKGNLLIAPPRSQKEMIGVLENESDDDQSLEERLKKYGKLNEKLRMEVENGKGELNEWKTKVKEIMEFRKTRMRNLQNVQ